MMFALFAGLAATFLAAERLAPIRREQLFFREGFFADALYVPIHYAMRVGINWAMATAVSDVAALVFPPAMIGVLGPQPAWLQAIVVILVLDFVFYVTHRLKHRWPWWWRLHETHHSSRELDWLSSVRFHPLEKALDRVLFLLPLTILGPSAEALVIWSLVDVFFGMFGHANVRWRIGPLIYLFVGPEMHRWHHSRDSKLRECNFGNNLSIFDWMFGTAYLSPDTAEEFGLADPDYPLENIVTQWIYAFRPAIASENLSSSSVPRRATSES